MDFLGLLIYFLTSLIIIDNTSAIYTKGRSLRFYRRQRSRSLPTNLRAPPTSQQIRLSHFEGGNIGSGRVEVFLRGKYGAICDNGWDLRNADVVCKQIGFLRGAIRATTGGKLGKASKYVMDEVECDARAQNVIECNWERPEECGTEKAAGVECELNDGCPDGWVAGPTGCYQILPNTVTRREFAVKKCAARGGHLINIETASENHFISHAFWNESSGPILTGGIKVGGKWLWEKVSTENNDKGTKMTRQVPIEEFSWFPGWLPGRYQAEPTGKKKERCLYLSNTFKHPNGSDVSVGYHFWLNDRCSSTKKRLSSGFRYICERAPEWMDVGCYSGIGINYRGWASFTKKGTPCMKWTDATDINPETYPGKGLGDHNHCRNPDSDESPWCWISEGNFEFCNIPKCPAEDGPEIIETKPGTDFQNAIRNTVQTQSSRSIVSESRDEEELDTSGIAEGEIGVNSEAEGSNTREIGTDDDIKTKNGEENEIENKSYILTDHDIETDAVDKDQETDTTAGTSNEQRTEKDDKEEKHKVDNGDYETIKHVESEHSNDRTDGHVKTDNADSETDDKKTVQSNDDKENERDDDGGTETSDHSETENNNNIENENKMILLSEIGENRKTETSNNSNSETGNRGTDNYRKSEIGTTSRPMGYNGERESDKDTNTVTGSNLTTETVHTLEPERRNDLETRKENDLGIEKDTDLEIEGNKYIETEKDKQPDTEKVHDLETDKGNDLETEKGNDLEIESENNTVTVTSDESDADNGVDSNVIDINNRIESEAADEFETNTNGVQGSDTTCHTDEFRCQDRCIPVHWRCDMEPDCKDGEDEGPDCDYQLPLFKLTNGLTVRSYQIETYAGATNETCARYCLNSKRFVCRSFSFSARTRECLLSHHTSETEGFKESRRENLYELLSQLNDCEGMFRCQNGRCLANDKVCDGTDDCDDFSDEADCGRDEPVAVRLKGGTKLAGRVEVLYKGEWGTICDDNWDENDATVVCHMLGFNGPSEALARSYYGSGEGNILLDEVACTGNETSIEQCEHTGWKKHDCYIWEIASAKCSEKKDPTCDADKEFFCKADSSCISLNKVCDGTCNCTDCADEKTCNSIIELIGGESPAEGRVELILNGIRGTICDDYFEDEDANVVCNMLGYSLGTPVKDSIFGAGNGTIWMDDVKCIGNETDIITCPHYGPRDQNCGHDEDVGVICATIDDVITVELEDGTDHSGRVILTRHNEKGTICDDSWDDEDATVICRMLGFRDGKALTGDYFGPGDANMAIFLDDVQCKGDELSIELCGHSDWHVHNCEHKEDAAVTCRQADDTAEVTTSTTTPPSTTIGVTQSPSPSPENSDCLSPGAPYTGKKAVTEFGFECQSWHLNSPHKHKHHDDSAFPDGSVMAAKNYCRSPDGDSVPWCYTTHPDERWQYCKVPKCKVNCFSVASKYTGHTLKTTSGHTCQRWSLDIPHQHKYHTDDQFADGSVDAAANYCRAPDGDVTPWCYTTDVNERWEYCNISKCAGGFSFNQSCGLRPLENDRDRRDVTEPDESYGLDYLPYRKMGRIYGGTKASYGMYPWQAGIRRRLSGFLGYHLHHCGGTIIGEYWILSAAHCFRDSSKGQIIIRTGDLDSGHLDTYEQEFDVETIIRHERYNSQDYDYDIALVKIRPIHGRGIVFNDYVQPACLPNVTTEYKPGYKCLISGWGEHEDDERSVYMKAARVPLVDRWTCNKLYKQTITSNMACAGFLAGGVDTCAGDSGGPLVCKINNKYTVMGVVSFGEGCAVPNAPGVYARVAAFVPWIKEKLASNS